LSVRRVVTKRQPDGCSAVASDEEVNPISVAGGAVGTYWLWGANGPVRLPGQGSPDPIPPFFPSGDGFRVTLFRVGADTEAAAPPPELTQSHIAEYEQKMPGLLAVMGADVEGFHTTQTVDIDLVVSGEVWLALDEGETHLKAGDYVVQQGTRHAWRNHSNAEAWVLAVLLGAVDDGSCG
jgi:hypothetical protein